MEKGVKHYVKKVKKEGLQVITGRLKWVYRYAKPHKKAIVAYTLVGMSGIVVSLISSLVSRDLVDIITGHKTGELVFTFCCMIGTTLGSTLIGQLASYISTKLSLKVDNNIKAEIFDEIMTSDWESLTQYHSGELLVRWSSDVSTVSSGILNMVPNLIIMLFRFFSALFMVLVNDASFAVFALLGVLLSILTSREAMKRLQKTNLNSMELNARMSTFNQETFSNVQNVKAFDMLPLYSKRLRVLQKEYTEVSLHYQKNAVLNAIMLTIVSMIVSYSAQGWGIYKVWSGAITYGTMVMFLQLTSGLSSSVTNLISLVPQGISLMNSAKRLMDVTQLPKEDYSHREEVREFYNAHKTDGIGIAIRDVAYAYNQGETVFAKVNAEAHPHEVIAFVGPSGEGKTTMLRFLLAIIRAKEGKGYICPGNSTPETDDSCMPLTASARQLIAYVPQGNTMFSGTIAENMRNVKEDASDEEIINALKLACAWKFVERLPNGINSEIKEHGGGFSEGQAQRLSIARALVRKSPILLMDEATSALDSGTQMEVLRNIMTDDYPRTVILTTHRPRVLDYCTRVYSIHDCQCTMLSEDEVEKLIREA